MTGRPARGCPAGRRQRGPGRAGGGWLGRAGGGWPGRAGGGLAGACRGGAWPGRADRRGPAGRDRCRAGGPTWPGPPVRVRPESTDARPASTGHRSRQWMPVTPGRMLATSRPIGALLSRLRFGRAGPGVGDRRGSSVDVSRPVAPRLRFRRGRPPGRVPRRSGDRPPLFLTGAASGRGQHPRLRRDRSNQVQPGIGGASGARPDGPGASDRRARLHPGHRAQSHGDRCGQPMVVGCAGEGPNQPLRPFLRHRLD